MVLSLFEWVLNTSGIGGTAIQNTVFDASEIDHVDHVPYVPETAGSGFHGLDHTVVAFGDAVGYVPEVPLGDVVEVSVQCVPELNHTVHTRIQGRIDDHAEMNITMVGIL